MYFNHNYFNPRTLLVSENHWINAFGEYELISFTAADRTCSCSGSCFRFRCGRVRFRRTRWTGLLGRRTGSFQTLFTELKLPLHRSLWEKQQEAHWAAALKEQSFFKILWCAVWSLTATASSTHPSAFVHRRTSYRFTTTWGRNWHFYFWAKFFKFLLNIQTLNSFKRASEKSNHLITSVLKQVQHLHLRSCWDSQLLSSNYKDIILQRYKRSIVHCRWLQNICCFSTKPPASGTQHWFASERWFMVKALELI